MDQTEESLKKGYRRLFAFLRPFISLMYPHKIYGQENIPEGPVIICANHSNLVDPLLIAMTFGKERFIRFMAKKELFSVPIVGRVLRACGVFPVDRQSNDIEAVRISMKSLKNGERVMIFPEGTRAGEDNSVEAKQGAIRIGAKLHVPLVPVYIPRHKKLFHHVDIVVGEPYLVEAKGRDEYDECANALMEKISLLGEMIGAKV